MLVCVGKGSLKKEKTTTEGLLKFIDEHNWDKVKDTELICLKSDLKPNNFLLIFTSKELLKNIIRQENAQGQTFFHLDAIYKLLQNGFSLLTIGTENQNHNFRFIAGVISSHEDTHSYERLLSRLIDVLEQRRKLF